MTDLTNRQINTLVNKYVRQGGNACHFEKKGMISFEGKMMYSSQAIEKIKKVLG